MMTIDEIRRGNARYLAKQAGGNARFAVKLGKSESYVSQIIGKNPSRGMREVAREIEDAFGKPEGWLDVVHPETMIGNVAAVTPAPTKRVPLISYVQAGQMLEVADPYTLGDGFKTIATDAQVSSAAFAVQIRGDSMEDQFNEGDVVVIDPMVQPRPGDFVVAKNGDDEATFKKYRPRSTGPNGEMIFELVPLNPDYPTLRSDVDGLVVVGVMMSHIRYRKP